jgi:signal-transduction protein with cAMP-binding, CBS, and nucleotidyltransferase domain
MTPKPKTIGPDKAVGHALLMMYDGGFHHVPVVERGKPLGMISARDALGPELQEFQGELVKREHIGEERIERAANVAAGIVAEIGRRLKRRFAALLNVLVHGGLLGGAVISTWL